MKVILWFLIVLSYCFCSNESMAMFPYLKKGDSVALVSPAVAAHERAIKILSQDLRKVRLVPLCFHEMNDNASAPYKETYSQLPYASSDEKRLNGFQAALNSQAKAIWILHGNQGCEKVVSALEKGDLKLTDEKKIIIGFSGATNLHL